MTFVRMLAAGVATVAISAAANAADLPSRKGPLPVMAAPSAAFTWAGSYIGVNLGSGLNATTLSGMGQGFGAHFMGGVQLGHNWQFGSGIVAGLETDIAYRAPASVNSQWLYETSTASGFLGTARVRLGMGLDRALVYVTGGLAYGNPAAPKAIIAPWAGYAGIREANNGTVQVGWTVGGGLEYAMSPNWSVKGEYLYADLGTKSLRYGDFPTGWTTWTPVHTKEHVVRAGLNYRFTPWGAPVIARY